MTSRFNRLSKLSLINLTLRCKAFFNFQNLSHGWRFCLHKNETRLQDKSEATGKKSLQIQSVRKLQFELSVCLCSHSCSSAAADSALCGGDPGVKGQPELWHHSDGWALLPGGLAACWTGEWSQCEQSVCVWSSERDTVCLEHLQCRPAGRRQVLLRLHQRPHAADRRRDNADGDRWGLRGGALQKVMEAFKCKQRKEVSVLKSAHQTD